MRISSARALALALTGLLTVGCMEPTADPVGPTATEADAPRGSARATVELEEFTFAVPFVLPVACLNSFVQASGTISGWVRTVTRPDGSGHVTEFWDASDVQLQLGDQVWTAGPGSTEMFVSNLTEGGVERVFHHQAAMIFRGGDGRPDLQLFHQLHIMHLPGAEEPVVKENEFYIRCVGPTS